MKGLKVLFTLAKFTAQTFFKCPPTTTVAAHDLVGYLGCCDTIKISSVCSALNKVSKVSEKQFGSCIQFYVQSFELHFSNVHEP